MFTVFDFSVQRYDPTYQATKLHFEDLAKRYGNPIIVLNLIKVHTKIFNLDQESTNCDIFCNQRG